MRDHLPVLYVVVPCFNEKEVLPVSSQALKAELLGMIARKMIDAGSKILFVNDGSRDGTWELIRRLHESDPAFCGISLSRNRGHQNALLAGLMTAKERADVVISIDADLQDDPGAMAAMVQKYAEGCEIVYGVRSSRASDSFFKRCSARAFYKLLRAMGAEVVFDHADYRLMSKKVLDALERYKEVNLFLRGVVPTIGYRSGTVLYERKARPAGESKYPLARMLALAFDGISSFSVRPIRLITLLGGLIFAFSFFVLLWTLWAKATGRTVSGWTSLMTSIWGLGGIQLLCLGLIGEYVGKIFSETKARPRYIIAETLLDERAPGAQK